MSTPLGGASDARTPTPEPPTACHAQGRRSRCRSKTLGSPIALSWAAVRRAWVRTTVRRAWVGLRVHGPAPPGMEGLLGPSRWNRRPAATSGDGFGGGARRPGKRTCPAHSILAGRAAEGAPRPPPREKPLLAAATAVQFIFLPAVDPPPCPRGRPGPPVPAPDPHPLPVSAAP